MSIRSIAAIAAAAVLAACGAPTPTPERPAPVASSQDGRLIRVGETVTATLAEADPTWGSHGRFHLYRFDAREGDRLVITMRSGDFDSYLVVGDRRGGVFNPIAEDDDSGEDLDARIRFTAPRTGSFAIIAQGFAEYGLGDYALTLEAQPEARPAVAHALSVGGSALGELGPGDAFDDDEQKHYDLYTFQARAGTRYAIAMSSPAFDAFLVLGTGNADFQEIDRNDDSSGSTDARILFVPPANGAYSVRATSYDGTGTGEYSISLRELVARGPAVVTPLAFGQTLQGALDADDQIADDGSFYDVYSFRGREGQRVRITMNSSELDSFLELGEAEAEPGDEFWGDYSDDDSGGNLDARIIATLWRTGEYRIHANSLYPDEDGAYTITLEEMPEPGPVEPQSIEVGATVRGELDPTDAILEDDSYFDLYTIRGSAGDRLRITLRSEDFDAFLSFGSWSRGMIDVTDSDDDGGEGESGLDSMLEVTLPASGTYAIQANSLGSDEFGSYVLTVERM